MPLSNMNVPPLPRKTFGPRGNKRESVDPILHQQLLSFSRFTSGGRSVASKTVGVEFEVEPIANRRLSLDGFTSTLWNVERDGSLRDGGLEYVLRGPLSFDDTLTALGELAEWFSEAPNHRLRDDSTRTSTHVHLNARFLTPVQVTNFACLWYIIEEAYSQTLPPSRIGNLFALRACDTQRGFATVFKQALANRLSFAQSFDENLRYGALNLASLSRFGSMELRILPGMTNPLDLVPHLHAYIQMHALCQQFSDPVDIITSFSGYGPEGFVRHFMPKMWALLEAGDPNQRYKALYKGMRYAQEIAAIKNNWQATPKVEPVSSAPEQEPSIPLIPLNDLLGDPYGVPNPSTLQQTIPDSPYTTGTAGTTTFPLEQADEALQSYRRFLAERGDSLPNPVPEPGEG